MSRHRLNESLFVRKKILTLVRREARVGFKATAGKRVTAYHFICFFRYFQPESCFPWQAMLKSISAHFGSVGLSQTETLKNALNTPDVLTVWLSSRHFFQGEGQDLLLCYCFGPNFREGQKFQGGKLPQGGTPLPPCGRKPAVIVAHS